ncbi:MAG TPA: Uma2 family endonuclease [Candidatus Acidoferrales bacterium]|nr:Uma2 family endonuclease [Candidatus Acidoferrales bacterium]
MSVATLIPVEEYLRTSYHPDVEYVDGVLEERNVGDLLHSLVQSNLIFALRTRYPRIYVVPELRSKTRATRYRLPDVCVMLALPKSKYLLDAAFLVVQVLSEDDRMTKTMERLEEFDRKGVPNIWVIDPRLRTIAVYSNGALNEVRGDRVATTGDPCLELTRDEIFQNVE